MKEQNEVAPTPSQTVGPFFHFALTANAELGRMAGPGARGERIELAIRVFDADAAPVEDCIIELWQADANGKYCHPEDFQEIAPDAALCGFGRMAPDRHGIARFETVRPGRVPGRNGDRQAPHINVTVLGRGLLLPLFTRMYFDGDPANAGDEALAFVPGDRRGTLLAHSDAERPNCWRFDVHLGGAQETVFFDL